MQAPDLFPIVVPSSEEIVDRPRGWFLFGGALGTYQIGKNTAVRIRSVVVVIESPPADHPAGFYQTLAELPEEQFLTLNLVEQPDGCSRPITR